MEKLFESFDEYPDPRPAIVTGSLPEWLEGRLYRLGPAKWDFAKDFSMNHWLDGCALIYKFTIRNGQVEVMSRFLDSEAYQKLTKIQRPVFTEFGTKSYPDPCKNVFSRFLSQLVPLELTDNDVANIYPLEDELVCATETCHLWRINKDDLTAMKKVDLKELMSVNLASSHPHISPDGTHYNLGASFLTGLKYHIYKIPPCSAKEKECDQFDRASVLCSIGSSWKTSFSYYHSFGLTERYILFLEQPLLVNTIKMAASGIKGHSLKECMEWSPKEKTKFHLVDRVSGEELKTKYLADAMFVFHHVNAYEEDGHVVADLMAFDNPDVLEKFYMKTLRLGKFDASCQAQLRRFVLPLDTEGSKGENLVKLKQSLSTAKKQDNGVIYLEPQLIGDKGFEMPTINYSMCNTKKYRYVYGSGVFDTGNYHNSLVKLDTHTGESKVWKQKNTMFPSEANFVPKPGAVEEDDGILLSVVLDIDVDSPDFLLVLDAKTFKEIARAQVPANVHLPPTIHGCFLKD